MSCNFHPFEIGFLVLWYLYGVQDAGLKSSVQIPLSSGFLYCYYGLYSVFNFR